MDSLQEKNNLLMYKFKSIDRDIATTSRCLLKGCQKLVKYSIQLIPTNEKSSIKNLVERYICNKHIKTFDSIKVNLVDDYLD